MRTAFKARAGGGGWPADSLNYKIELTPILKQELQFANLARRLRFSRPE